MDLEYLERSSYGVTGLVVYFNTDIMRAVHVAKCEGFITCQLSLPPP